MRPLKTWVLVADGAQARVYENSGPGNGLVAVDGMDFGRNIALDTAGGGHQPSGDDRNNMSRGSDPASVREAAFIKELAHKLDESRQHGRFTRLVVAAAPTALGELRKELTPALKECIVAELPKDLTSIPKGELDSHFADVLAV